MNNKTIGIAVVALIVGGAIGYFTHPASAQMSTSYARGGGGTFTGARGAGGPGAGAAGGFLTGTVAAKDASSITLNTRDGSSHVVLLSPSTSVSKTVTGSLTDVSVGASVMIIGTTNSDGSVLASMIQLRPAGSFFGTTSTPAR